jgi:hypothetical protein
MKENGSPENGFFAFTAQKFAEREIGFLLHSLVSFKEIVFRSFIMSFYLPFHLLVSRF